MITPTPRVLLNGSPMASTLAQERQGYATVLDSLSATWGRRSVIDHHESQQARFTLVDYGQYLGNQFLMGKDVTFEWSAEGTTRTFFRGRIGQQKIRPRPLSKTGRYRGAFIDLTCVGTLTDASKVTTNTEAWPAESGAARVQRLRSLLVPGVLAGVAYRDYWGGAPMAARKVNNSSALGLLKAMYDTAGADRMSYDPHTNTVQNMPRNADKSVNRRAYFDTFPDGVAGRAAGNQSSGPVINGRFVEGDGVLTRGLDSIVSLCVFSFMNPYADETLTSAEFSPLSIGSRSRENLTLSTELVGQDWATIAARDWLELLNGEGSLDTPEPLTYRGDLAGGFPSLDVAQTLIGGAEVGGRAVFVAGSQWAPMGQRNTYTVGGGTINYDRNGWRPTFHLLPFWTPTAQRPTVTIDQLTINGGDFTLDQLHPAVSFDDFGTISTF